MASKTWMLVLAIVLGDRAYAMSVDGNLESATWHRHELQFNYFGITSHYSCDGLEGKVKQILLYLGARVDAQVTATGCPRGGDSISASAWVRATINTPSIASDASSVNAQAGWTELKLAPSRPSFIDAGDCELVDQMRKVLIDNFSWRRQPVVETRCEPHAISLNAFRIEGEVLKMVTSPAG